MTRINSLPNFGSRARQLRANHADQSVTRGQSPSTSHVPLEVGSMVEVVSTTGVTVYGVIRWLGVPRGKTNEWAGIELVSDKHIVPSSFQWDLGIWGYLIYFVLFRTMRWMAALMGNMELWGISPAKGTGLCLFLSQSAALIAGLSAPLQEHRPSSPPMHPQVRYFLFAEPRIQKFTQKLAYHGLLIGNYIASNYLYVFFSPSIWGLRRACTSYSWIGGVNFATGKNERDSGSLQLLLPWCHTVQVKPAHHPSGLLIETELIFTSVSQC